MSGSTNGQILKESKMNLKDIKKLHKQTSQDALALVEREARNVMKHHPKLVEFVMGMGDWGFYDKRDNYLTSETTRYLESFGNLIDTLDDMFGVTGEPMRFTVDGKVIKDW